jgi:hypothetical protein
VRIARVRAARSEAFCAVGTARERESEICSGRGTESGECRRDVRAIVVVERCAIREESAAECVGEGRPVEVVSAACVENGLGK